MLPHLIELVGEKAEAPEFEQAYALLKRAKARLSGSGVAASLGLSDDELGTFEKLLRDLGNRTRVEPVGDAAIRNAMIAALRFLDFCTLIGNRLDRRELEARLLPATDDELARKQLRALELLLRSLVTERYGGQEKLREALGKLYGEEQVKKWLASADPGDLLSGTVFSDLAGMFVNKREYPERYQDLFKDTDYLIYLKEQRQTLQAFLDDVRRFRNVVAHNKRISPVQLTLLDLYYREFVDPVEQAHKQGRVAVNPADFLTVGKDALDGYFKGLREDTQAIRDDIQLLTTITRAIDQRTVMIAWGVKALMVATVISSLFGAWEVALYLYNRWETRELAARFADVASDIYHQENNPEVATALLNRAIELQEGNPRFRTLKAYIDGMASVRELLNLDRPLTKEELDRAHFALANAAWLEKLDPKAAEAYILRGQIYMALGQWDQARTALETAIRLEPDNDFAYTRLGALKQSQKDAPGALAMLDKALAINPKSKWAWLWKGVVYGEIMEDWDKARDAYDHALALDPRFDMAHYNIAWSWLQTQPKNYAKARAALEEALKINPNYKEALYALGMVYGYQNQYEPAKTYLGKALAVDPRYTTAWKWRGVVNDETGDYAQALADFGHAIELSPGDADGYVRRARVLRRTQQYNQAVADLAFAGQLAPRNFRIWLYQGEILALTGQLPQALENFNKALEIDPNAEMALAGRAEVKAAQGDVAGAEADFAEAVARVRYRPERVFRMRGQFLESRGRVDEALADYHTARTAAPRDFDVWLAEARLLVRLNRWDDAAQAVNAAIQLRPQDQSAIELRNRLRGGKARP
ncbi:MAG TPA: STY4199 family HEPN domain-containing protein [Magnetospirillum sp.]|nr:STY4199 family HEPN domain-containing protein [Magnetospirillum sp.]